MPTDDQFRPDDPFRSQLNSADAVELDFRDTRYTVAHIDCIRETQLIRASTTSMVGDGA